MATGRSSAEALGLALLLGTCAPARTPAPPPQIQPLSTHAALPAPSPPPAPPQVDFQTQIRPILEARCRPCHFEGGTMHESLPFDRPETLHTLGEKLFTRIRDEREQTLLRSFLAQGP
jgi:hypothetical protein